MPKRSLTGLLTVAPSVGSTKNTRGALDAGLAVAAVAAGGVAVDVVPAAGSGSLPPQPDAVKARAKPRACHDCRFLPFMRESPLRHILHKPSTPTFGETSGGWSERQHPRRH